jgi:penicillin-binding protein 1A
MAFHNRKSYQKLLYITVLMILFFFLSVIGIILAYSYFSYDLPRIESLKDYRPPLVTEVYSSKGELIGEFFLERRYLMSLRDISPLIINAIIAAEDDKFYEHKGIDLWSIIRAAIKNIRSFEIRQGGSTITQQIVKSLLLTPERSFSRKIKEAILARRIERHLSKDEILTLYLNQIYFGRGAYGVEAASRVYFGKSTPELTLAEVALLAGLIKAPNYYSPFRNPQGAKHRQSYVLTRMLHQGYITLEKKIKAEKASLNFFQLENINGLKAPYFVEYIRREIERKYGSDFLYKEGMRVETTLDTFMQNAAQESVAKGVSAYEKRAEITDNNTRVQSSLVSMNPFSGYIKAMVGGRDYQESQFNRAIQAQRQPGSAFKPIIYAAALDKGYTPASIIIDAPLISFEEKSKEEYTFWEPQNYDKRFLGPTTLRKALTQSRNIVTIKILRDIGVDYVIKYARKLGLSGEFNHDLTLGLGTCGLSLLNLVKAYSSFSAQGICVEPIFITRILDRDGNIMEENHPLLSSTISPQTAYIMTTLLQSVVEEGTGRRVRALKRPCAGKTGTTDDVRDAWFIGFTPQLVTGVWVGFDDLRPLGKHETGAVAASPIWLEFMQTVLQGEPIHSFKVPDGIVFVKINPETGYFPIQKEEKTIFECFKEGTLPTSYREKYKEG